MISQYSQGSDPLEAAETSQSFVTTNETCLIRDKMFWLLCLQFRVKVDSGQVPVSGIKIRNEGSEVQFLELLNQGSRLQSPEMQTQKHQK